MPTQLFLPLSLFYFVVLGANAEGSVTSFRENDFDLHPAVNPQERRCFRLRMYVLSVWISQMQQRAPRQK